MCKHIGMCCEGVDKNWGLIASLFPLLLTQPPFFRFERGKVNFPPAPAWKINLEESVFLIPREQGLRSVRVRVTRFSSLHLEVSGRRISDVNGRETRYTNPAS